MPIDNNKFVQKLDLHSYQQNITNPVIYHQNPITRQYPIQNLSPVALPNVINVVPGGILVSTCSQMPILSHNIYVNQNIIPIPPNTITPRSLGVQGINQAYQSLPSTSLVPPAVPCAQNVSQSIGHGYQASLPPIVSHGMRVSPRNVLSKVQQPCHSKMNICPHAIKNTICQGAKRRLYSAVLSNTNTTMDSDCDELEREALEQYRPSEESLKDSSDDSIQAKYQELERLAMEQYTTSSSSASSESCALGNGSILVSETGPPGIRTAMNSESNTGIIGQNIKNMMPQIKSAIVRKSNSNLSMGSKLSSTMMLPSIGEVSNDEADSPKNNISPRGLEDNSSKRRIIVVKSTSRQVSSDHSSDAEENDDYGPQIVITSFGQKKKEEFSSTISTDRSEIEFKLSLLASVENLHESTPGPKSEYYIEDCKEYLETKCLHGEKLLLEQSNIISNSKKEIDENSSVKSTNSNLPPCSIITREVKSAGHNKRRQGRKAKKVI
ncbi:uncharacterized protein LOC123296120 [Chrysoperla carnea]|uniref:uncharacterized protein LOC123296120 n=1 Tax=Chrysoperla carnea TaxID=189513 RepID=UPI001D07CFD3|nr:uncharacterized protein LOC123296120 [Chrysoperla carnea]